MKFDTIFCFFSFLFLSIQAGHHKPQQLQKLAFRIMHHHGNPKPTQKHLIHAFKNSISETSKFKPTPLQTIVAAIAHKNSFQQLSKNQSMINEAIDNFHSVPGFLFLLSRLLESANSHNTAHFNGALWELEVAVGEIKKENEVLSFGKKIHRSDGTLLTEIDIETEDKNGAITWQEVKIRNKLELEDVKKINKQLNIQRKCAQKANVKHVLEIRFQEY